MSVQRLSPLDASFLELEEADGCSHMHVGWAMVFDPLPGGGAPDARSVRLKVGERLGAMPRFAQRLSSPRTGGLSWPTWEDDPLFDLGAHVRHATLPSPGGDDELLDWLADFYSHRLDRTRPLWEVTLLDGLAGGRWALALKVHHCLIDGVSGSAVTALLLDSSSGGEPALAADVRPVPDADAPAGLRGALVQGARAGVETMLHPRRLLDMAERGRALAGIVRDDIVPAADTSLNVPIGATRRLATVETPLAEMKAIKRELGGKVNDVALAATAGGLRRLFISRGERPPDARLRVMVPVSLRDASETLALGNRVSSLFVEVPVGIEDPLERYRATVAATENLKSGRQAAGAETVVQLAGLAPPALHALVARLSFTPRLFNLTVTNVPGPPSTLFAFGAPMRRIIPLVPIFALHAAGIAVVSYDGRVVFGLNGDRGAMPDLDVLARGIEVSLGELRDLAQSKPVRERRTRVQREPELKVSP